jgi:hypothetical protein
MVLKYMGKFRIKSTRLKISRTDSGTHFPYSASQFPRSAYFIFVKMIYGFSLNRINCQTIKTNTMKNKLFPVLAGALFLSGMLIPAVCYGQDKEAVIKSYLTSLPAGKPENVLSKYIMTAVYTNRDLYGKFMNKLRITGDYSRGFEDGHMMWNNVFISNSASFSDPFPEGVKQEYIENFKYYPDDNMLSAGAFKNFPANPENIFARNMIWDMMTFEVHSWNFYDSLKLNIPYVISQINGEFDMAEIGKYNHNRILICWKGISEINGELCSVIDFNAIDNIIELTMDQINSKGTEQYWGTVWLSMKTKNIEQAIMYSGTIQEVEVKGMNNKILIKTIRELSLEKIR